ncbi:hypothetical protein GAYE_SCF45G5711 [Galdieria yellowstonensis]|uniref:Ethanolaminephosphotransferase n=1 Tax=Galdieria yellowstonensis TaxID=3028027 RepID=A0AAV9IK78_9RHOD|nr:hypothetical protein GAYE_SCF45G5711 [Galdieria yellowstonensis]
MRLTKQQLQGLLQPCASGKDLSLLYRKVLAPLYDKEVERIPSWIAPNVLTISGLLCTLSSTITLLYYSPDLVTEAPRRVYVSAALATFLYMMFDNLDGRQARRTNSSSPLGHLFDHSCDALNVIVLGLAVAAALRLGRSLATLYLIWSLGMVPFFFSTLEELLCGSLTLRQINGANEGLLGIIGIFIATSIFGTSLWLQPLQLLGIRLYLQHWILCLSLPLTIPTVFASCMAIGSPISRRFLHACWITFASFGLFTWNMFCWALVAKPVFVGHFLLFMITVGLLFFRNMFYLMIAHVTHSPFPTWMFLILNLTWFLVIYLSHYVTFQGYPYTHALAIHLYFLYQLLLVCYEIFQVVRQICNHLEIYCFRLGKRKHQ